MSSSNTPAKPAATSNPTVLATASAPTPVYLSELYSENGKSRVTYTSNSYASAVSLIKQHWAAGRYSGVYQIALIRVTTDSNNFTLQATIRNPEETPITSSKLSVGSHS